MPDCVFKHQLTGLPRASKTCLLTHFSSSSRFSGLLLSKSRFIWHLPGAVKATWRRFASCEFLWAPKARGEKGQIGDAVCVPYLNEFVKICLPAFSGFQRAFSEARSRRRIAPRKTENIFKFSYLRTWTWATSRWERDCCFFESVNATKFCQGDSNKAQFSFISAETEINGDYENGEANEEGGIILKRIILNF